MDELLEFQKSKKYLFHGSSNAHSSALEPRQAMSHGKWDGAPCVAASEYVDPAIFMAVLGSKHIGGWGKKELPKGKFGFYIKKKDYSHAQEEDWNGYVYVLKREEFSPYMGWEWRAHTTVHPINCIMVNFKDLPKDIELEEN